MFARWWRLDEEGRQGVWRLYGVFTAFMCIGSCVGAAAWAVNMVSSKAFYTFGRYVYKFDQPDSVYTPVELASMANYSQVSIAAFQLLYSVEFLCLSIVKLFVLDRMEDFFVETRDKERWAKAGRVVMTLVVAGGVVGIGGNIVSVVYRLQAAGFANSAESAFAAKNIMQAVPLAEKFAERVESAVKAQSIQEFSEIAVLLILIAAFVVVGVMCARRVNSSLALMTPHASAKAKYMRRQIVVTAFVVFVTFLLRSIYTSMIAIASALQDSGRYCATICSSFPQDFLCPKPLNMYTHMYFYLNYSPEFQLLVVLISSPLALLVALWGMTSGRTLHAMRESRRQMESIRSMMLRGEA
jgi:hypothetical protein